MINLEALQNSIAQNGATLHYAPHHKSIARPNGRDIVTQSIGYATLYTTNGADEKTASGSWPVFEGTGGLPALADRHADEIRAMSQ